MHIRTDSSSAINDTKEQIIFNLKTLKISETAIQRIMSCIEIMPCNNHVQGSLAFLSQITDMKSKREDYYQYSNLFAEYFCTISNLGLFAVAYYYRDFATLAAATFSALSHAIPLQRLHDLDLLGVFFILGKAVTNYKLFMDRPDILAFGAGALTINVMDTYITRKYLDKIGPSLHVTWHLAAALALYKINQGQVEASAAELGEIASSVKLNSIPSILQAGYETITAYMSSMGHESSCIIL